MFVFHHRHRSNFQLFRSLEKPSPLFWESPWNMFGVNAMLVSTNLLVWALVVMGLRKDLGYGRVDCSGTAWDLITSVDSGALVGSWGGRFYWNLAGTSGWGDTSRLQSDISNSRKTFYMLLLVLFVYKIAYVNWILWLELFRCWMW